MSAKLISLLMILIFNTPLVFANQLDDANIHIRLVDDEIIMTASQRILVPIDIQIEKPELLELRPDPNDPNKSLGYEYVRLPIAAFNGFDGAAQITSTIELVKNGKRLPLPEYLTLQTHEAMMGYYITRSQGLQGDLEYANAPNTQIDVSKRIIQVINTHKRADVISPQVQALFLEPSYRVGNHFTFVVELQEKGLICTTPEVGLWCPPILPSIWFEDIKDPYKEPGGFVSGNVEMTALGNNAYRVTMLVPLAHEGTYRFGQLEVCDGWGNCSSYYDEYARPIFTVVAP